MLCLARARDEEHGVREASDRLTRDEEGRRQNTHLGTELAEDSSGLGVGPGCQSYQTYTVGKS